MKDADGWSASEVSLAGAADIEDVADRIREIDPTADLSLLFVESDDAYLVILRLDHGEDLRIFGSDAAFAEESRIGALLLSDLAHPAVELAAVALQAADLDAAEFDGAELAAEPDDDTEAASPAPGDADPAGDADLLSDLGVTATRLLKLCGHEGMLPSDITAEVCQAIGCGDEVEELREI